VCRTYGRALEEREVGLKENPNCAEPDYKLLKTQLNNAGLSARFDHHEATARHLLESEWALVNSLSSFIYTKVICDPTDIIDFIEQNA
jgi:hypothetical protein